MLDDISGAVVEIFDAVQGFRAVFREGDGYEIGAVRYKVAVAVILSVRFFSSVDFFGCGGVFLESFFLKVLQVYSLFHGVISLSVRSGGT